MNELTPAHDRIDFCQAEGCLDLWEAEREGIQLCARHAGNVDRVIGARRQEEARLTATERRAVEESPDET